MKTPKKLINAIDQYKNGNEDIFNSIYELSYKKLYTCLLHIVQDKDAANNIAQDTYDEIKKDSSNFKAPWEFLNIAASTGSKLCYAYMKQENNADLDVKADEAASYAKIGDNERFLPDKLLQDKEKIGKIREVIDGLSALQRLCVIAFYYAERKTDDIAKMLEISADEVQTYLNVFKAKLKKTVGSTTAGKGIKLYGVDQFMHQFFTKDAECVTTELVIPAIGTRTALSKKKEDSNAAEKSKKSEKEKSSGKKKSKKFAKQAANVTEPDVSKTSEATKESEVSETPEASKPDEGKEKTLESAETKVKSSKTAEGKAKASEPESAEAKEDSESAAATAKKDKIEIAKAEPSEKPDKAPSNIKLTILVAICAACIGFLSGAFYMNYKISSAREAVKNEAAEEVKEIEETEEQAVLEEPEPEEIVYLTEITGLDKFDDYGRAYGGIIPVAKDGKFGAINYQGEIVIPCEYESCFSSADDSGSIILADGDIKKVFDANGKLVYEGADDVRVSGGMYITLEYNDSDYSAQTVFHKMDGKEVLSFPCEYGISHINVFYDGICTVQQKADEEDNKDEEKLSTMIGTVTTDGKVSWRPDESYLLNNIISTENHGYYISRDPIVAPTILNLYDTKGELIASADFGYFAPDNEKGFEVSDKINEENMYYGFWANGGYLYNYGSKMVFGIGDKKVLVDFAKAPGMQVDSMTNDIVTAVYDEILLADEKYWLVGRDGKWGYIDQDGKEMHMYDDASAFSNGKAFVVENGKAFLIDENFEKVQDMGDADRVALRGELLYIEQGGQPHVYMVNK